MLDTSIKQALQIYEEKERERRKIERDEEERKIRQKYAQLKKEETKLRIDVENVTNVYGDAVNADPKEITANVTAPTAYQPHGDKNVPDKTVLEEHSTRIEEEEKREDSLDWKMHKELEQLDTKYLPPNCRQDKHIKLWGMIPPITKMDNNLAVIGATCEKLSLSTNQIEKIQNLTTFKHLRTLSLARNNVKNLSGLEAISDTLEELFCSYNYIEKLKPVVALKKLKKFYLAFNLVKDWTEVSRLSELHSLVELNMFGNILVQRMEEEGTWRKQVKSIMKALRRLDNVLLFED